MTANPVIIGAGANRSRSSQGERRSPSPEARDRARSASSGQVPAGGVIHGDCIRHMRSLPGASVDFVLTDPPYITRYRERGGRRVAGDDIYRCREATEGL